MKFKVLVFLVIISFCIYSVELTIAENIEISGFDINLGHVFENIPSRYKDIRITGAANAGGIKRVHINHINQTLKQNDLPPFRNYSPQFIEVKTKSYVLTKEEVEVFLKRECGLLNPEVLNFNSYEFPIEEFNLKIDRLTGNRAVLDVNYKNKNLRKIILRYIEKINTQAFVATRNIQAGEDVKLDDFKRKTVLVEPDEISNIVSDKEDFNYARTGVKINKGSYILKNNLNLTDIVINGSIVQAVQSGDGFFATTRLKAIQAGAYNEIINLRSLSDRRRFKGRVIDENKVELIY
ncbi:MAG: flagellar basal body P-ring formation chaperone FlgA [Candidatus Muiribacteriota bacterium]